MAASMEDMIRLVGVLCCEKILSPMSDLAIQMNYLSVKNCQAFLAALVCRSAARVWLLLKTVEHFRLSSSLLPPHKWL